MKTTKLLVLTCVLSLNTVFAQENNVNDDRQKAYEMPRTHVITINNSETKAQNTLYIKLPEGYEENNDTQYPVIYFTHPVMHIEILSAATESLIEDVILVGLTWQKGMTFGKLDSYLNFIRNDVFKTIENNYRADADRRTYFGYSSGALVGAYILTKHPNTFENFILGSPALGVDHEVIQKIYELESTTAEERKKLNANVFISYGTLEGEDIPHFEKFITMLKNINDESLTLQHVVVEGNHHTSFPMTAVRGVIWLSDLIKKSSPYTIAYSWGGINLTDNEGKSKNKIITSGGYAAWSPDGKRFAYYAKYDERKTWSIHTMNSDGTNRKRLTHVKNKWDNSPAWSPDGTKIAFSREYEDSEKNWKQEVWIMNSDGSQQTQIKPIKGGGPYFTPDGRIVFHSESKNKKTQISIADIDGNNIIQLTHNEAEEQHPEVSPNGKQIAFMSDRDGSKEIYVMNIDGSNQKQLTSSEAAKWYPSWSPDGSKIIFSSTSLDGERNIYMMNKDGSSVKKIITNGTQPAWSKTAN